MKTVNEALAFGLTSSGGMIEFFCGDLTPEEYLHRPTPDANCAAWLLGHLTLIDRHAVKLLNGNLAALPEGYEQRFARDKTAPKAGEFGDVKVLIPLFRENRQALIEAVKNTPASVFEKVVEKPTRVYNTIGEMLAFYSGHTAMHSGQITIIRRSLGRPPLV